MPMRSRKHRSSDRSLLAVHGAGEFDQDAVPHDLDDTAPMPSNGGLEDSLSTGLEGGQRASLIQLHEPAVTNYVGRENGG